MIIYFKRYCLEMIKQNFLKVIYKDLKVAFSVKTHLTYEELLVLYKLSKHKCNVVEIGSYVGASTCCFGASAVKNQNMKIICIDTWNNDAMSEGFRDTWGEFNRNTARYSKFIIPIRGFSVLVSEQVLAVTTGVDLLFIDGDHSYEGVKADWDTYKNFLKPGSVVVFHDYGWATGVRRVVHDHVLPYVASHDCLPNMWWGTVCKHP